MTQLCSDLGSAYDRVFAHSRTIPDAPSYGATAISSGGSLHDSGHSALAATLVSHFLLFALGNVAEGDNIIDATYLATNGESLTKFSEHRDSPF